MTAEQTADGYGALPRRDQAALPGEVLDVESWRRTRRFLAGEELRWEAADAEAGLVDPCWAAIAACGEGPPGRPGLALVDAAREGVRASRGGAHNPRMGHC
jgi:hypothetical protein